MVPPPPQISGTSERFDKIQAAFDSTRKFIEGKSDLIDLRVTVDVTGQVKVKMFNDFPCLAFSCTMTLSNGNESINEHRSCLEHLETK